MATKVGAFKKDGTVQCVKLVEEKNSDLTSKFSGTITNKIATLDNGLTIKLYANGSLVDMYNSGRGTMTITISNSDNASFVWSISESGKIGGNVTSSTPALNEWNSNKDLVFNQATIFSSYGWTSAGNTIKLEITNSSGQVIGNYQGTSNSTSGGTISSTTPLKILKSERMIIHTAHICKDGTLKCSKLIEEAPISLASSFGGTISGGGIDLDNGYRLQFKSGSSWDTAVNKTTFPDNFVGLNIWIENSQFSTYGIWFSRSGKTNRCTATFNESSYEDRAPIIWGDTNPIKMYFNQLTIEEEASGGYDRSYFTSTYLAMYNKNKELIFYYTFTGYDMDSVYGEYVTPGTVPHSDRWKTATVRISKDGTIRCAKLEEATLNYDYVYKFNGVVSGNTITFNNGIVAKFYKGNTSTPFIDIPDISYLYFSVDGDITKGQPAAIKESEIQISSSDTNVWEGSEDSTARTMTYPVSISQIVLSFASASLASYTNLIVILSDGTSEYQYNQGYKEGTNIELYPYNTGILLDTNKRFSYSWN